MNKNKHKQTQRKKKNHLYKDDLVVYVENLEQSQDSGI